MIGAAIGFVIALIVILVGDYSWWWLFAGALGGVFIELLFWAGAGDAIGAIADLGASIFSSGD